MAFYADTTCEIDRHLVRRVGSVSDFVAPRICPQSRYNRPNLSFQCAWLSYSFPLAKQNKPYALACRRQQDIRPPLAVLFVRRGLRVLGWWSNLQQVCGSPSRL